MPDIDMQTRDIDSRGLGHAVFMYRNLSDVQELHPGMGMDVHIDTTALAASA